MKRAGLAVALVACASHAPAERAPPIGSQAPLATTVSSMQSAQPPSSQSAAPEPPCRADTECRFDPSSVRCGTNPSFLPQPEIVDQGHLCYCDDARGSCEHLRVLPVPCESDASCAVDPLPRPRPVAASGALPHRAWTEVAGFAYAVTCERTNICTLRKKPIGARR